MPCYIISYDLRNRRVYDPLYEAIQSYATWAHILESSWAVVTSRSAQEVRDHLADFIDSDDGIFVSLSGGEAAWRNVLCNNAWLKERV